MSKKRLVKRGYKEMKAFMRSDQMKIEG